MNFVFDINWNNLFKNKIKFNKFKLFYLNKTFKIKKIQILYIYEFLKNCKHMYPNIW